MKCVLSFVVNIIVLNFDSNLKNGLEIMLFLLYNFINQIFRIK